MNTALEKPPVRDRVADVADKITPIAEKVAVVAKFIPGGAALSAGATAVSFAAPIISQAMRRPDGTDDAGKMQSKGASDFSSAQAALDVVRQEIVNRRMGEVDMASNKMAFVLSEIRASDGKSTSLTKLASLTLDELVRNSRDAAEISSSTTGDHSQYLAVENGLSELNTRFERDYKALQAGAIKASEFMPGAELITSNVQRDLNTLHSDFQKYSPASPDAYIKSSLNSQSQIDRERETLR